MSMLDRLFSQRSMPEVKKPGKAMPIGYRWARAGFGAILAALLLLPHSATAQEPSLQAIFDSMFGSGEINVATDETGTETFTPGVKNSQILVEFAGNAGSNSFGWYPVSDPNQLHTIFSGSGGAGGKGHGTIPEALW